MVQGINISEEQEFLSQSYSKDCKMIQSYQPMTTVKKVATPAAIIMLGSNLLQFIANQIGVEIGEENSYIALTSLYSLFRGLRNWIKNRKK